MTRHSFTLAEVLLWQWSIPVEQWAHNSVFRVRSKEVPRA